MKRVALTLLALLLSSLCYLYGAFHEVPDSIYTGIRSINASDYNQHLSWIEQSREGHFFLKNLYTSDLHDGFLVRPIYFVLSLPFAWIPVSNAVVFHILRVLCGFVLLLSLFPLFRNYEKDSDIVQKTFLLLVFTSGAGFFLKHWISQSADLAVPETILFVTLGEAPHFLYSLLLLWIAITCIYRMGRGTRDEGRTITAYFVSLALIWWEHPFEAVVVVCVSLANVWQIRDRRRQILIVLGTGLVSLPAYLYYEHLKKLPAFSGWGSVQNLMLSPPLPSLLCAFLPLFIFGIISLRILWRDPGKRRLLFFLVSWILIQFVLAYAPFPFQRRLIAGVQFPLALLAAYGLRSLRKPVLILAMILFASASNVLLMSQQIKDISIGQMPYYLPAAYDEAFKWLDHQKEKQVVLSGFVTGNFIPGYSGFAVYLGHSSLTPNILKKRRAMVDFYRHPDPEFLEENRIQYIFWGLEERRLSTYPLNEMFPVVYEKGAVQILSVRSAMRMALWARL